MFAIYLFFVLAAVLVSSSVSALFVPQASVTKIPFYTKRRGLAKRDLSNYTSFTDGVYYYAEVQIGSPPQKFDLILDTGSSDLFVSSKGCSKTVCQYRMYDESASTSYVAISNDTFSNKYGVDPQLVYINGSFGYETVTIGGITVKNQKFARAYNQTSASLIGSDPQFAQPEGIVGLGFPSLTGSKQGPYNPLLFNMYQQGSIPRPVFSWYYALGLGLSRLEGELTLGGVDPTKYTGEIVYTPVLGINGSQYYWQSYIQALGTKDKGMSANYSFAFDGKNSIKVVFDTGTPLSVWPTAYVKNIYADLTGNVPEKSAMAENSLYYIDCGIIKTEKRLHMSFSRNGNNGLKDEHPLTIDMPVSSLIIPFDNDDLEKAKVCALGIQYSNTSDFFLLGQTILHNFYLSFDFGKNQTGFAAPINSTSQVFID
ncbi:aspartic peptidase domain-containing protein [Sporodiniella umbellata]|nr:aspartic peptidase domain-containing protein [Sporodiniella umbellata]